MKRISIIIFALFCIGSFSSCDKKEGEMGPQGEQGLPGKNGPDGVDGRDGDSYRVATYTSEWIDAGKFTGVGRNLILVIPAPEITQEVLDKSSVSVYFTTGSQYFKLPWKEAYASTQKMSSRLRLGEIEVHSTYGFTGLFRYIIMDLDI